MYYYRKKGVYGRNHGGGAIPFVFFVTRRLCCFPSQRTHTADFRQSADRLYMADKPSEVCVATVLLRFILRITLVKLSPIHVSMAGPVLPCGNLNCLLEHPLTYSKLSDFSRWLDYYNFNYTLYSNNPESLAFHS